MIILGVILLIAGGASLVYGIQMNNSLEHQLESIFSNGTANPGTPFIAIGAVVAVVGLLLLIFGLVKNSQK